MGYISERALGWNNSVLDRILNDSNDYSAGLGDVWKDSSNAFNICFDDLGLAGHGSCTKYRIAVVLPSDDRNWCQLVQ